MLLKIPDAASLLQLKDEIEPVRGLVRTENGWEETSLRSGEVRFIKRDTYPKIFYAMQSFARKAQAALGIDQVLEIKDNIQLSTYYPGDFYGWHKDGRVMSASLLVSDKFTGGRMEFKEPGWPLLRKVGQCIFFPNIEHRVKPVSTGVRDSLVVWWS